MTHLPPFDSDACLDSEPCLDSDAWSIEKPSLENLLNRRDIWRGDSYHPTQQLTVDTGYPNLNAALLHGGWPKAGLIEICQKGLQQHEWMLFLPVLAMTRGYILLVNPPGIPFCQAFIQAGIELDRIIVVNVTNKADFLSSFSELARTQACEVLFAWQHQNLSYTELRKCLLATHEGSGLCIMFRPEHIWKQSSPAILRLQTQITSVDIQLRIFKQKGVLESSSLIKLSLPDACKGFLAYSKLDQSLSDQAAEKHKSSNILPLRVVKKGL